LFQEDDGTHSNIHRKRLKNCKQVAWGKSEKGHSISSYMHPVGGFNLYYSKRFVASLAL